MYSEHPAFDDWAQQIREYAAGLAGSEKDKILKVLDNIQTSQQSRDILNLNSAMQELQDISLPKNLSLRDFLRNAERRIKDRTKRRFTRAIVTDLFSKPLAERSSYIKELWLRDVLLYAQDVSDMKARDLHRYVAAARRTIKTLHESTLSKTNLSDAQKDWQEMVAVLNSQLPEEMHFDTWKEPLDGLEDIIKTKQRQAEREAYEKARRRHEKEEAIAMRKRELSKQRDEEARKKRDLREAERKARKKKLEEIRETRLQELMANKWLNAVEREARKARRFGLLEYVEAARQHLLASEYDKFMKVVKDLEKKLPAPLSMESWAAT